jgi:hypothetical protein
MPVGTEWHRVSDYTSDRFACRSNAISKPPIKKMAIQSWSNLRRQMPRTDHSPSRQSCSNTSHPSVKRGVGIHNIDIVTSDRFDETNQRGKTVFFIDGKLFDDKTFSSSSNRQLSPLRNGEDNMMATLTHAYGFTEDTYLLSTPAPRSFCV